MKPIREVLDDVGLAWRAPRSLLAERRGIRPHPAYGWDVIEVETAEPIVDGLLWPLSVLVRPQFSPNVPATDYSGLVWFGDDARENLRRAETQLTPKLGNAVEANSSNTVGKRWNDGPASLSLTVWPAELQHFALKNPSEEREPRLKAACHLEIKTGFRPSASPTERASLASFERIARIADDDTRCTVQSSPAREAELEFVREPFDEIEEHFGFIGYSLDRAWLMFFGAELHVVPLASVIGFHVERVLPAKGPGGSSFLVECRTDFPGCDTKRLTICSAPGPEDSNELAALVSARTGKPFTLGPHQYDA